MRLDGYCPTIPVRFHKRSYLMFKRIPGFVLWAFLAVGVALLPLACGSSTSSGTDSGSMSGG
jgi:hypothetical protein